MDHGGAWTRGGRGHMDHGGAWTRGEHGHMDHGGAWTRGGRGHCGPRWVVHPGWGRAATSGFELKTRARRDRKYTLGWPHKWKEESKIEIRVDAFAKEYLFNEGLPYLLKSCNPPLGRNHPPPRANFIFQCNIYRSNVTFVI